MGITHQTDNWHEGLKDRQKHIFLLLIVGLFIGCIVTFITCFKQSEDKGDYFHGTTPAIRGRILDRNGTAIVWSQRSYDLHYMVQNFQETRSDLYALADHLGKPNKVNQWIMNLNKGTRIWEGVPVKLLIDIENYARENSKFVLQVNFERKNGNFSNWHDMRFLGKTRQFGNIEKGISGIERQFDHRLSGTPGQYRVRLDRNGEWITSTFEVIRPPRPGYDIYLKFIVPQVAAR
ncbi:MAG: hypothetical protein MK193_13165 [Lentisphaeria bacterium]|nr:hypothetical protein [Lentisphaeria bacterium]